MSDLNVSDLFVPILPKIQHYAWGDTQFIPSLLRKEPDGKPNAELWFGTHPRGEATLVDGVPFGDFLRDHAQAFLGKKQIERYGKDLPFLLKVLAIGQPLSLQVHPNTDQALRGFSAEVASHVDTPAELWNYQDDRQKSEVLYALTPITALCGFISVDRLTEQMRVLIPQHVEKVFPFLLEEPDDNSEVLEQFFTTLYSLESTDTQLLIEEFAYNLKTLHLPTETADGQYLTAAGVAELCLKTYPHDPSVLAPFFLNVVHLAEGQALYLEPRTLHAYIHGHGVELMSNSDNVLRAGLTVKHIQIHEVFKTLSFKPQEISVCPQTQHVSDRITVLAPSDDFLLRVYQDGTFSVPAEASITLLFCTEGKAVIDYHEGKQTISQGSCIAVASSAPSYQITVTGRLFSASIPC